MLRECCVKTFHRRAMSGTNRQNHVPVVAHNSCFTCHKPINMARNDEKLMRHTWHANDFANAKFSNLVITSNTMIINLIQRCNHCCEVCDKNNLIKTEIGIAAQLPLYHFLNISLSDFQRKQTVFLPKILGKLNHNF